jgi:hypothetical protein
MFLLVLDQLYWTLFFLLIGIQSFALTIIQI